MHQRKVALHTNSYLTPTEVWRKAVSTNSEGRRVSSKVWLENCTQVWVRPNLDSVRLMVEEKQCFTPVLTCPNLSKPARTCPQYSDHVRSSRSHFCTFKGSYSSVLRPILLKLHTLTHLVDSFPMVYGVWSCVEINVSILLRSSCLQTFDWKPFERRNFLVLRPVLLKMAYSSSANRQLSIAVRLVKLV